MNFRLIFPLLIIIVFVWTLAMMVGCADMQYVDRPVEVLVPVSTSCIKPGDVPEPMIYPVAGLSKGDSDGDIVGALWAEREQRADTETVLRAIIDACTGDNQ